MRPRSRWRIVAAGVVIASAAAVGAYAWFERTASTAHPLMLAVLPFENVGDGAVGYFTDGITDEIRGDLSRLPGLQVIARGSSVLYGHGNKPPEQIARELGVSYLLTGQVRWAKQADGAMIASVEPELIRAMAGRAPTVYWQQRFDVDPTNALEVQGDIASNVASVLHVVAGATERQALLERPTNNAAAYDAYLQGEAATQGLTTTDPPALWRGIGYYTKAATADSTFLFAWTRLSRSYARLYANSTPTPANADAAQRALEHAEALAPDRLETQIALSDYVSLVEHDERRAYAILSALLQRYPDNVQLIGASPSMSADWVVGMTRSRTRSAQRSWTRCHPSPIGSSPVRCSGCADSPTRRSSAGMGWSWLPRTSARSSAWPWSRWLRAIWHALRPWSAPRWRRWTRRDSSCFSPRPGTSSGY